MAKKSKATSATSSTPVTDAAPVVAVITPAPVAVAPAADNTAQSAAVLAAPAAAAVSVENPFTAVLSELDNWRAALRTYRKGVNEQLADADRRLRALRSDLDRAVRKTVSRRARRRAHDGKPRPASGFAVPGPLSKELCQFLNVPEDTKMARTDVTRSIHTYIKSNDLRDPADKRIIRPNKDLTRLLRLKKTDNITYFKLQKHMTHLFPKKGETQVTDSAPVVASA